MRALSAAAIEETQNSIWKAIPFLPPPPNASIYQPFPKIRPLKGFILHLLGNSEVEYVDIFK